MEKTKEFPLSAALTLSTGFMMCDFSELYGMADWLLGYPVYTHEFADDKIHEQLTTLLHQQVPGLPIRLNAYIASQAGGEWWIPFAAEWENKLGKTVTISRGTLERMESPLQSFCRIRKEVLPRVLKKLASEGENDGSPD